MLECPLDGVAVALPSAHRHILISVIHDTLGGRVSLHALNGPPAPSTLPPNDQQPAPGASLGRVARFWAGARTDPTPVIGRALGVLLG